MRPAARRGTRLRLGARAPASPGRRHEERRRMVPARWSIRADPVAARRVEPPRDRDAVAKVGRIPLRRNRLILSGRRWSDVTVFCWLRAGGILPLVLQRVWRLSYGTKVFASAPLRLTRLSNVL